MTAGTEDATDWVRRVDAAGTPDDVRAVYEAWAPTYDPVAVAAVLGHPAPPEVADALAALVPPSTDVLDAGCGTGMLGAELTTRGFTSVDGLDLTPAMIRAARRRRVYHDLGPADLTRRLPGAGAKYGLVVAIGLLRHGQVGPGALAELARVVRPGGAVVATVSDGTWAADGYDAVLARLAARGLARAARPRGDGLLVLEVDAAPSDR